MWETDVTLIQNKKHPDNASGKSIVLHILIVSDSKNRRLYGNSFQTELQNIIIQIIF